MRVWLMEKEKTYVPTVIKAVSVRYSRSRNSLVIDGNYRWYEIVMSVDDAKELVDDVLNNHEAQMDLRKFRAIGFDRNRT